MRWLLDRVSWLIEIVLYLPGAVALSSTWHAQRSVIRRQLKYLRTVRLSASLPFSLFYALPYVSGSVPNHVMNLSVLSMALIPLTWAYAITRYRLMDVDIIFQQGYVYTLATLAVIGTFYGLIFLIFNTSTITPPAFVVLISFATFVFQPIRRWIQEQLDRWVFYRDRYDARVDHDRIRPRTQSPKRIRTQCWRKSPTASSNVIHSAASASFCATKQRRL